MKKQKLCPRCGANLLIHPAKSFRNRRFLIKYCKICNFILSRTELKHEQREKASKKSAKSLLLSMWELFFKKTR